MKSKNYWLAVFFICLLASGCSKKKNQPAEDGSKEFEGAWSLLTVIDHGKEARSEMLQNMTATVESGVFRLSTVISSSSSGGSMAGFNKAEIPLNTFYESAIQVDKSKSPTEVDFVYLIGEDQGKARKGIYLLEGNQLKICIGDLGAARPSEFVATSENAMIVLVRKP